MDLVSKTSQLISSPKLSLPKGGGAISGLSDTFNPDGFGGAGTLSIPLYATPAREITPELSIDYNSSDGNGIFGFGFSLNLSSIQRRTDQGIPKYEGDDTFILTGEGQLTPKLVNKSGKWIPDEWTEAGGWLVRKYVPRSEHEFALIEHWIHAEQRSYWKVVSAENVTNIFGQSDESRIANPQDGSQVFSWLLQERYDAKGNRVLYTYKTGDSANIRGVYEQNRCASAQRYIHSVQYGNYFPDGPSGKAQFCFEMIFDYGEYDLDKLNQPPPRDPYKPVGEWKPRRDPFSSYKSGFEIRTNRLCRNVLLFHRFPELGGEPHLVRVTQFDYDETPVRSLLTSVTQHGYRKNPQHDVYDISSLPPLQFVYSQFEPAPAPRFQPLTVDGREAMPGVFSPQGFQPIDMNSEGLPGFLYSDDATTLFYEPLGNGKYQTPQPPSGFPDTRNLQSPLLSLSDLDGDGEVELVVAAPSIKGYFDHHTDGSWGGFQSFASAPAELGIPQGELVDLGGDGKADLLLFDQRDLVVYPSAGTHGYGPPRRIPQSADFPCTTENGARELATFTDIFGDGLSHRVRVRDGSVEAWPSLGYGHFDKKVTLANAPQFDQTTSVSRIFFADVDGSGTADLVLAYADRVEIYLNQSGNAFADTLTVPLPESYSSLDQILFADILGYGATALVFSKTAPQVRHWYHEFCGKPTENGDQPSGSPKPYLLIGIDNNLGIETEISYSSSTKFYLADKRAGRPWVTQLPFPVQVVESIHVHDQISGLRLSSHYAYHDGHYDPVEREFRGFGYVESWDGETVEAFRKSASNPDFPVNRLNQELHVPPVHTKTWFHTGTYLEGAAVAEQYRQEYYAGDNQAHVLPASQFDPVILAGDASLVRQAHVALKGVVLRREVYAVDDSTLAANPYSVFDANYHVQLQQPQNGQKYASFYVYEQQSLTYHYERNPHDPRISHSFVLKVDPYGNVEESCDVYYGRRPATDPNVYVYPEQSKLKATLFITKHTQAAEEFRWLRIPFEEKSFELHGLDLQQEAYFSFDALQAQVARALEHTVSYGENFDGQSPQARLFSWQQSWFWNATQHDILPLGQVTAQALLHHRQEAVFSEPWLHSTYGGRVDQQRLKQLLAEQAGYSLGEGGYWWNRGLVQCYYTDQDPDRFFLPCMTLYVPAQAQTQPRCDDMATVAEPPAGSPATGLFVRTAVTYDVPYVLRTISQSEYYTDQQALTSRVDIDYVTVQPWQQIDMNRIVNQVRFDPLGMVVATSIFKPAEKSQPRQGDGNLQEYHPQPATFHDVLYDKPKYLQQATTYFFYDLLAWHERKQPANYIELARQTHVSDVQPGEQTAFQTRISYLSGLGGEIETKLEVEPGPAVLHDGTGLRRDERGQPLVGAADTRWLVSGRSVLNNKALVTEQYLPYYSDTPAYETQQQIVDEKLVPPSTIVRYDALRREIRVDSPKGFFAKVEYTPWQVAHYDENDTVKESPYWHDFFNHYPQHPTQQQQDERAALLKAAVCYNTPALTVLDNMSRTIRTIENNLGQVEQDAFAEIVNGTLITSAELWNELRGKGYLVTHTAAPGGTWVSGKFQPYVPGFELKLDARFQPLAKAAGDLLRQNCLTALHKVDIEGRELEVTDPRLFYANLVNGTDNYSFRHTYAMDESAPAHTASADAGLSWRLVDILGDIIETWDERGFQVSEQYDRLRRPTTTRVTDKAGHQRTTQLVEYGESQTDPQQNNLWGRVYQAKDEAGVQVLSKYGLQGHAERVSRQLLSHYKQEVDWSQQPALERHVYQARWRFNALQQLVSETTDDGSVYRPQYYVSGRLQSIQVAYRGGTPQPFLTVNGYSANNQRLDVTYDNQVKERFTYEDTTQRLLSLDTTRPGRDQDGQKRDSILRQLRYTYDPVGNVTEMRDGAQQEVFCYNQQVAPHGSYTYDPIYQLVQATGRQHPGIQANTHQTGLKQSLPALLCPPHVNDQVKLENYTERYEYDESGNLLTTTHQAQSSSFTRHHPVVTDSNRLQGVQYDGNGNPHTLDLGHAVTLSWDYRDRLLATTVIQRPDGDDDRDYFVYDQSGQRVRKVVERVGKNGGVTSVEDTVYLGSYQVKRVYKSGDSPAILLERQTLCVMDGETCVAILHYWVTDVLQRETEAAGRHTVRYQLDNLLGSVTFELDGDAAIITYEEYFPYGGTAVIAGRSQKEIELKLYRYSSKERDDSTGLYYYGARYYPPWLGRWLNPDPAGAVDGLNLYAFVGGNPVTHADAGGLCKKKKKRPRSGSKGKTPVEKTSVKGRVNRRLKVGQFPPRPTVEVREGTHWTAIQERMKAWGGFAVHIPLFDDSTDPTVKKATVEPRHHKDSSAINYYFTPHAGFDVGGGGSTDYGVFPVFIGPREDQDFKRLAARTIKGTLESKGYPTNAVKGRRASQAVLFGGLAMTSEWARHPISPIMALTVLGYAKKGQLKLDNLTSVYIAGQKGGSNAVAKFGNRLLSLHESLGSLSEGEGAAGPQENAEKLYNGYARFFDAAKAYLTELKETKATYTPFIEDYGAKAGTVFAFLHYMQVLLNKYHHLWNTFS